MNKLFIFAIIILLTSSIFSETVLQENFETGILPDGWSEEYVDGTTSWSYSNGGYNGHPASAYSGFLNARFFYNNTDGNTTKLVTSQFNLGINEVGTLTFYHAQQAWVGYQDELRIYYKNSPEGEWILLSSYVNDTPEWTLRQLTLPSPSTTYYLAFEGFSEYGYGVCLDDIHVDGDPMYNHDLQGYSIDGPQNITAGNSESFAVTIFNAGIEPQSDYEIKLFREGDIEIAFTSFSTEILPGSSEVRYIVWDIPETEPEAYTYIYGRVDLASDENVYNNTTDNLNIHILPQGTEYVIDVNFEEGMIPPGWIQEYVTGQQDWIVQTGGHLGNPPSAHGGEYNAAFLHSTTGYATKLISPDFNLGTANNGTLNFWHAQAEWATDQDELHIYYRTSQATPWTLVESYTSNTVDWTERTVPLPNPSTTYSIAFEGYDGYGYGVCLDDIIVVGQPTVYDNDLSGQVVTGATIVNAGNTEIYQVLIKNVGNLPQSSYTVSLMKSGNMEIASLTVNEIIQPGEIRSHDLQWNIPVSEPAGTTSIYGKVVLDGDENTNNDQTPVLEIEIYPQGILEVTVGEGVERNNRLPVSFQYLNSLTESIYLNSELNNITGFINAIAYYNSFTTNLPNEPITIWMGETNLVTLVDGWIAASELTLVFDGNVNFPSGDNEIRIDLTTPYYYGGQNLVVMVHRPMDTATYGLTDYFYLDETPEIMDRTRYERDDEIFVDPNEPPDGYSFEKFPNTKFIFYQGTMGDVAGFVYDDTGEPLEGALITIEQTQQIAYTNESGEFLLGNVLIGNYEFTASAFGYTPQTVTGEVTEGETLDLEFNLLPLGTVTVSGMVAGSDYPETGLENASVSLTGFDNYQTVTNAEGEFVITDVYANLVYDLTVTHDEYQQLDDEIMVEGIDLDLGTVIVAEITSPPTNVYGEQNLEGNAVELTWNGPGVGGGEFRYDDGNVVGQIGFSNTPPNAVFGAVHNHNAVIQEIHWYLTSDFGAHSNVKLILLGLNEALEPDPGQLLLLTGNLPNVDDQWNSYELSESVDAPNGFLVGVITANQYTSIALDDGEDDPWEYIPGTQLASENWVSGDWTDIGDFNFDQNMLIRAYGLDYGEMNAPLSSARSDESTRVFESYSIYRFPQVYQNDPDHWIQVAESVLDTIYTDFSWSGLDPGDYQFAVTSIHTNGVESIPSFSNIIYKTTPADADDEILPADNVLYANVPNPFNPETTISFQISGKNNQNTELIIYNIKGQRVKVYPILKDQSSIIWDGTDSNDQSVPSGIYLYKLSAGDFSETRKMLLLK